MVEVVEWPLAVNIPADKSRVFIHVYKESIDNYSYIFAENEILDIDQVDPSNSLRVYRMFFYAHAKRKRGPLFTESDSLIYILNRYCRLDERVNPMSTSETYMENLHYDIIFYSTFGKVSDMTKYVEPCILETIMRKSSNDGDSWQHKVVSTLENQDIFLGDNGTDVRLFLRTFPVTRVSLGLELVYVFDGGEVREARMALPWIFVPEKEKRSISLYYKETSVSDVIVYTLNDKYPCVVLFSQHREGDRSDK
jgi:hypothetical protein